MKITRAGVDIAKSVFHVHAVDRHDQLRWQAKLKRGQWLDALSERLVPGAEVGMEACASAHHWSPRTATARLSREADRCPVRQAVRQEQQE